MSWINRTALSGSSVDPNGTNSHTCDFTAATSGSLLVAIVAGAVTFTTPSGWTLLQAVVGNSALYVFYKTASASESSFSTTHNGSDYPIRGVVYEFATGSAIIGNHGYDEASSATENGVTCTGLSGNYVRLAARAWTMDGVSSTASAAWTTPSVEDYDVYTPDTGSADGIALTIAYDDDRNEASFTADSTYTPTNSISTAGQDIAFAVLTPGSIAFVQSKGGFDGASTDSLSVLFDSSVTAGNLIVVALSYGSLSVTPTVTDTQGNTYSLAVGPTDNGGINFRDYIYYAIAGSTGSNSVQLTLSANAQYKRLLVHEYSGVNTLDATAGASGADGSGAPNSGSASTSYADELIFGWGLSNNGVTAAGAGFTLRQTTASESTEDKIVTETGSYNVVFPDDGSAWICQMATFYSASSEPVMSAPISWYHAT